MKQWKTEPTERFFYLVVPEAHVCEPVQRQISSGTSFGRLENAQKYFNPSFHSHILKIEISEKISMNQKEEETKMFIDPRCKVYP